MNNATLLNAKNAYTAALSDFQVWKQSNPEPDITSSDDAILAWEMRAQEVRDGLDLDRLRRELTAAENAAIRATLSELKRHASPAERRELTYLERHMTRLSARAKLLEIVYRKHGVDR